MPLYEGGRGGEAADREGLRTLRVADSEAVMQKRPRRVGSEHMTSKQEKTVDKDL